MRKPKKHQVGFVGPARNTPKIALKDLRNSFGISAFGRLKPDVKTQAEASLQFHHSYALAHLWRVIYPADYQITLPRIVFVAQKVRTFKLKFNSDLVSTYRGNAIGIALGADIQIPFQRQFFEQFHQLSLCFRNEERHHFIGFFIWIDPLIGSLAFPRKKRAPQQACQAL
jgi:hypothetical protein